MMMWYGGNWGWGGWLLMTIAMVLFWALIITAVVLIVRYVVSQRPTGTSVGSARTPEEVLAERYARGEIDDEEYQRRLALLRQNR
ncbi:MAG TPA: SHOCT domain-containing protein [Mycobacterium sp.]|nr:SHOCT domain-containing protein [Mycobacterium sp.]